MMTETESAIRASIVKEARSWIRTPYHKRAFIKGVGADCGMFPYAVLHEMNLVPDLSCELPYLKDWQVLEQTEDWFCHTSDQRYARVVERYFRKLVESQARRDFQPEFLAGNLVLVQTHGSRVYNHAGIISSWPRVVHCAPDVGVAEVDAASDPFWMNQRVAVYDVLSKASVPEAKIVQDLSERAP